MERLDGQKHEILLIDDDELLGETTAEALECFEFQVRRATNANESYSALRQKIPNLILLDLNLPEVSGHEICAHIRKNMEIDIPILVLSGNKDESDIIKSLDVGADDFVAKTTSFEILLAHIRAVLRRNQRKSSPEISTLHWGKLTLNRSGCVVKIGDNALELTPSEYKILEIFLEEPGIVFTRGKLIERMHGSGHHLTERTIDVHINGLRNKLGDLRYALETVRSVGYRFAKLPL